jgi:hypothetical protein
LGSGRLRKVVLGERARMQAQAVPLSVQRALSDSDRDSGDKTEGRERRGGEKSGVPKRNKVQAL